MELAHYSGFFGLLCGMAVLIVIAILDFRDGPDVNTKIFDAFGMLFTAMVTAFGHYVAMHLSVRISGSVDAPGVASAIAIATYIAMGLVVALCIGWIVRIVRHPEPKYRFWTPTTIGTGLACAAVASSVLLFALVRLVQSIGSSLTT